ncbi:hypothetical protein MCUN1_000529 [Malassezia cuniculi]|uniref:DH domain-containing protein n=1 Tax=Malassezia cuniculi TaxID=948313 RepID=A0AAF0ESR3_9BASI|nr:hypothetical protein MCUN1_000529 [Malassezia cuniculi]
MSGSDAVGGTDGEGHGGIKQEWADVLSTLKLESLGSGPVLISPPTLPTFTGDSNDGQEDYFDTPRYSETPETDISRTSSTSTKGSLGSDLRHSEPSTESDHSHGPSPSALGAPIELVAPTGKPDFESESEATDKDDAHTTSLHLRVDGDAVAAATEFPGSPTSDSTPAQPGTPVSSVEPELSSQLAHPKIPPSRLAHMRVRRMHSLLELADTERSYVGDLETLIDIFFGQLHTLSFFADNDKRTSVVVRNIAEILPVHKEFSKRLDKMVESAGIARADIPEAERAESEGATEAVAELAQILIEFAPKLKLYADFCSRHKEALALIEAAEHRAVEWDAFQQRCAELAFANASARSAVVKRLLFRDYLIKPVQRLCLYPVVLDMLLRNAADLEDTQLHEAIEGMRHVVEVVDEASRKRDVVLHSEAIASRIEVPSSFPPNFLSTLGNCLMAGNLDVLYHHATLAPLAMPLPIKYYGCLLYESFVLIVKGVWPKSAVVAQSPGGAMRHFRRLSGTEMLSLRVPRPLTLTTGSEVDLTALLGEDTDESIVSSTVASSQHSSQPPSPNGSINRHSEDRQESTRAGARLRRKVRDAYLRSRVSSLDAIELESAIEALRIKRGRSSLDGATGEAAIVAADLRHRKSVESLDSIERTLAQRVLPHTKALLAPARGWFTGSGSGPGSVYENEDFSSSQSSLVGGGTAPSSRSSSRASLRGSAEKTGGGSVLKRSESFGWLNKPRDSLRRLSTKSEDTSVLAASTSTATIASASASTIASVTRSSVGPDLPEVVVPVSRASISDASDIAELQRSVSPQRWLARRFFQQNRMSPVVSGDNARVNQQRSTIP